MKKEDGDIILLDLSLADRLKMITRYLGSWGIYSASFMILLYAFDVTDAGDLLLGASINSLAWSIGYLSIITPSGAGVREGIMTLLLEILISISEALAVVISASARIIVIIGELIALALYLGINLIVNRNGS